MWFIFCWKVKCKIDDGERDGERGASEIQYRGKLNERNSRAKRKRKIKRRNSVFLVISVKGIKNVSMIDLNDALARKFTQEDIAETIKSGNIELTFKLALQ